MRSLSKLLLFTNLYRENLLRIQLRCPQQRLIPMVKANAYGHGMLTLVKAIEKDKSTVGDLQLAGWGVATLKEAAYLAQHLQSLTTPIIVFSENLIQLSIEESPEILKSLRSLYLNPLVIPVISSLEQLKEYLSNPLYRGKELHLKLNTGMNRLGLGLEVLPAAIDLLKGAKCKVIHRLYTHYGAADDPSGTWVTQQQEQFLIMKKILETCCRIEDFSLANSGALEQGALLAGEGTIRPGLCSYGPSGLVSGGVSAGHQLISSLESQVIGRTLLRKGQSLGYGMEILAQDQWVITLPIGYGDGFSQLLKGARLEVEGTPASIIGRVNMDMIFIALAADQGQCQSWQRIKWWGPDQPRNFFAMVEQSRASAYQFTCSLNSRLPRVYDL